MSSTELAKGWYFLFKPDKATLNRYREIDRGLGRHAEKLSRFLWPWREQRLLIVIGALAVLDFTSTLVVLELFKKSGAYESGVLANWALQKGGFPFLFVVDSIAAVVISTAAFVARHLYSKHGYYGYGRAAFVFLLLPYIFMAAFAVFNNLILLLQ